MTLHHHHPSYPSLQEKEECILEQYRRCLFALQRERTKSSPACSFVHARRD